MEITVKRGALTKADGAILILTHYEGNGLRREGASINKATGGMIQEVIASEEFSGKFLQTCLLRTYGKIRVPRLLLLGLGKRGEMTLDRIRQAMARAATQAREMGLDRLLTPVHGKDLDASIRDLTQAMIEGVHLGLYQFQIYKTDRPASKGIKNCTLIDTDGKALAEIRSGADRGKRIAEAVSYVRDLCNTPSNMATPSHLAEEAKRIATEYGMNVEVYDRPDIERLGMGALFAVARGTVEPPKFIVLEYEGGRSTSKKEEAGRRKKMPPIALIGKSVTFDSGGVSLKPSDKMEQMKYDMSGGATVLGVMKTAAQLNLPMNIVGLLPATDNMPSGTAVHPGDVVTTLSGKTVEIINTDAEGRLCLADALTYAVRYRPAAMIDLATLTGACVVALGHHAMGLMGNDPKLIAQIERAGEEAGERVWQLPLWDEYLNQIKSDVADLKNVGGRGGGAITAGLFLKQFVEKTPWVHLDIAGTAWNSDGGHSYIQKGATGVPLRLLIQFLTNRSEHHQAS